MSEFKGTKGKWFSKVTRSSNINGDEAIVIFSDKHNSAIDKGICRLTILNCENKVVQDYCELKYNALLISKAPKMLEMLIELKDTLADGRTFGYNDYDRVEQLIKEATEL